MKIRLIQIVVILISIITVSCFTKKVVMEPKTMILPLGDTVHLTDGSLVYGLPLTVLDIEVDVEKRIEKQGPYSKYANDLLGIKDIVNQDKETWSITGIRVNSFSELDPGELYVIQSNTLFQTNVLALRKSGLILDLNPEIYERSKELRKSKRPSDFQTGFLDMGADEYFVNQVDTAFRLLKLDTAFIKIPYLVEKKKQLTFDQLAEKAAKSLLEMRDGKHLILTGEANVFPQDKSALDEMNRLEKEYLALFAGKTWTESRSISYSLIPQKDMTGKPVTLFKFSTQTGLTDAAGKTGTPVNIQFIPVQKTKDLTVITRPDAKNEPAAKYDRLYYRMPEVVSVNIKMGEENLYNSRKLIYQFGQILQLPANYLIGK
jgi:hypothetical protein